MGDGEVTGKPVEVFFVLMVGDDAVLRVVAKFSGFNRLGLAQQFQRQHGGYIVKALDWEKRDA